MSAQDREAIIKISAKNLTEDEFKKVKKGLAGIGSSAGKSNTKVSGLHRGISSFSKAAPGALKIVTAAAVATAAAVVGIAAAVIKLGERGAAVGDVASAFDQLALSVGSTGASMLGALADGVKGTISNFDLMKVANKALGTGLLKTDADARTMAEGARLLAKRTGGDTVVAFETLITAMASGRTAQLKQIGLFVDNKRAIEEYAKATGQSVSEISDADRAQALQVATMKALRAELEGFPPPLSDFGELLERGRIGVRNFTDELAVAISESPVLLGAMKSIGESISEAFGDDQQGFILTTTQLIEKAAIAAVSFGIGAVESAQAVHKSWGGLQVLILGVTKIFVMLAQKMAEQSAAQLELASGIPLLGRAYTRVAAEARAVADEGAVMTISMQEQLEAAALAAQGHTALGEKLASLNAVLVATQTKMVNAGVSTRDFNLAVGEGVAPVVAVGTAFVVSKQQLEDMRTAMTEATTEMDEMSDGGIVWADTLESAARKVALDQMLVRSAFSETGVTIFGVTTGIMGAFQRMGLSTREQLKQTAEQAKKDFETIAASGKASAETIEAAKKKMNESIREMSQGTAETTVAMDQQALAGSSAILGQFATKNKASAIAKATIDTILAVQRTFAQLGWPAGLIGMAVAATMGAINVAKIAAQPATFREGTNRLDFENFGAGTPGILHGREAVIPQGKTHILARELADAMGSRNRGGDPELTAALVELRSGLSGLRNLPREIQRAMRDGIQLAAV